MLDFYALPERIRNKIRIEPNSGCWLWAGAWSGRPNNVYGATRAGKVHRLLYEFFLGKIPEGLDIDHLCRTTVCCNPLHLEPVTAKINYARGIGNQHKHQTHCIHGHEFSEANTYFHKGIRHCKECNRRRNREK